MLSYIISQAYGLKFIINVEGLARKFSLKNTVLNIGNGLALLGITTVLCELVLMYFIKVILLSLLLANAFIPDMFQDKDTVARKKYDYVSAMPSKKTIPDKATTDKEEHSNFGTQTFSVGGLE